MKNQAFTLIELLVVVLIIGILAAIAVPKYQVAVLKSRLSQGQILSSDIRNAEQSYYLTYGKYTLQISDLDISVPECIIDEEKTSQFTATAPETQQSIYYDCANDTIIRLYANNGYFTIYIYVNSNSGKTLLLERYMDRFGAECASDYASGKKACIAMGGKEIGTYGGVTYYKLY